MKENVLLPLIGAMLAVLTSTIRKRYKMFMIKTAEYDSFYAVFTPKSENYHAK